MASTLLLLVLLATLTNQSPLLSHRQSALLAITVPATAPSDASNVVDHTYPGFAFSAHSFHQYAGNKTSPNVFSRNLINQVSQRTGTSVHVRVGGTSGDYSSFDPNQQTALDRNPAPGVIPKGVVLGPAWYEGFASWPGVKWTFMAHFANYSNLQNSIDGVKEAIKNIPSGDLDALEIGNEINFYVSGGARPAGFDVVTYLEQWETYSQAIRSQILNGGNPVIWQAPVLLSTACPWCISNVMTKGQSADGNIKSAALHHYMDGSPAVTLQANYMNHTRVVSQLNNFQAPIAWLQANRPKIPLHLAEDNSNTYSTNNYDKLGTFGNTLWLADYMLYAATINVARMNVQQSTGFAYSSWRGVDYAGLPKAVLPPYYAHPFVADVIANGLSVRLYNIAGLGDEFAAYGVYDGSSGQAVRIVLFNLLQYNANSGTRPSKIVTISLGSGSTYSGTVKIEKLTAPGADVQDASQVSWKGTSWTAASNGNPVTGASTTTTGFASRGRIGPITIRASEALLLTL